MIEPFADAQVREGVISYGVSSYGYDVRIADEFKIFTNINSTIVDPKNFDPRSFVDFKGDVCVIPPNSFALARTVEYFRIPRNVVTVCVGKSTYARCGIIVNVTPFEPEWEGIVTLEVSNTTPLPAKIYANEGIAQVLFFESDEECETSYADKKGKYQAQKVAHPPQAVGPGGSHGPRNRHDGRAPHRLRHPAQGVRAHRGGRRRVRDPGVQGRQDQRRPVVRPPLGHRARPGAPRPDPRGPELPGRRGGGGRRPLRGRRRRTGSCPTSSTPPPTSTPTCAWTGSGRRRGTRRWTARSSCATARRTA